MKQITGILIGTAILASACNRVAMERSPEALVPYGVPSQHSNSVPENSEAKAKAQSALSWTASSAIDPKPRRDY